MTIGGWWKGSRGQRKKDKFSVVFPNDLGRRGRGRLILLLVNVHSLVWAKTKLEAKRVGKYMVRPVVGSALTFDGDHRLDDTVAMIENGLEGLLDAPERKSMSGHETGLNRSRGHEVEGPIQAVVLAADVLKPELLAPQSADVEGDPLLEGNADHNERSPGLEEADRLVDGLLLAAALENEIEAERLVGQNPGYDVRLEGIPRPACPGRAGGLEAGGDLFGHEDTADALGLKAEADA